MVEQREEGAAVACRTQQEVIDRGLFSSLFDAIASTPGGQPFIAEEGQVETLGHLVQCLRGGADGTGRGREVQCGVLSTEIGKRGREITGPQKAAAALKQLIQEVRVAKPEINEGKNLVRKLLLKNYAHIFGAEIQSSELLRYNFYLYQLDGMRKADLRRMDDISQSIDTSNLVDFTPVSRRQPFSPLLITPNLNIELSCFAETFEELMSFPNYPDFAAEFAANLDKLYQAKGYSEETNINNMIVQLLLLEGYIRTDDLARGSVIEKVNRETIAAAKYAVVHYLTNPPAPASGSSPSPKRRRATAAATLKGGSESAAKPIRGRGRPKGSKNRASALDVGAAATTTNTAAKEEVKVVSENAPKAKRGRPKGSVKSKSIKSSKRSAATTPRRVSAAKPKVTSATASASTAEVSSSANSTESAPTSMSSSHTATE